MAAHSKPFKEMHLEEVKTRLRPSDHAFLTAVTGKMDIPVAAFVRQAILARLEIIEAQEKQKLTVN